MSAISKLCKHWKQALKMIFKGRVWFASVKYPVSDYGTATAMKLSTQT